MSRIRRATTDNEEDLYEMVLAFNAEYFGIPINPEKLEQWVQLHLQAGIILMSEDGFISGLYVPDPLRDHNVLLESGWFSRDNHGARLLLKFINHAREIGVDEVRMTTLSTSPEAANQMLTRLGFEPVETSWRLLT